LLANPRFLSFFHKTQNKTSFIMSIVMKIVGVLLLVAMLAAPGTSLVGVAVE
jgi:ABC-type Mn2+/Zn2+ transport system permease subunit